MAGPKPTAIDRAASEIADIAWCYACGVRDASHSLCVGVPRMPDFAAIIAKHIKPERDAAAMLYDTMQSVWEQIRAGGYVFADDSPSELGKRHMAVVNSYRKIGAILALYDTRMEGRDD